MLSVVNADYRDGYKILLQFNDNREGVVDLKEFIVSGEIKPFKQLQDIEKFKAFEVDYTLKWAGDLDLVPEYLYYKVFEKDIDLQEQFHKWGYI
jgi:hypothetical protein